MSEVAKEYTMVCQASVEDFIEGINSNLEDDWILYGHPIVSVTGKLLQAMIKVE